MRVILIIVVIYIFPVTNDVKGLFMYILFNEMFLHVFCPFLIGFFAFYYLESLL